MGSKKGLVQNLASLLRKQGNRRKIVSTYEYSLITIRPLRTIAPVPCIKDPDHLVILQMILKTYYLATGARGGRATNMLTLARTIRIPNSTKIE